MTRANRHIKKKIKLLLIVVTMIILIIGLLLYIPKLVKQKDKLNTYYVSSNENEVLLYDQNYKETDKIGFVTEERSLLAKLTVYEMIEFYGTLKGMKKEDIIKRLDYWLNKFNIKEYKYKKIKELSKGNQQKIQFISGIINEPKLLILDEPFTGLDPINVGLLKDAVKTLQRKGCSIIFSSHQMEYIEDFCEDLIILVNGKVILSGNLDVIKKNFAKKNIYVKGENIPIDKIKKLKGVTSIEEKINEYIIHIENENISKKVFDIMKTCNITKYVFEDASLNEIFIHYVGGKNE